MPFVSFKVRVDFLKGLSYSRARMYEPLRMYELLRDQDTNKKLVLLPYPFNSLSCIFTN